MINTINAMLTTLSDYVLSLLAGWPPLLTLVVIKLHLQEQANMSPRQQDTKRSSPLLLLLTPLLPGTKSYRTFFLERI